MDDGRDVGPCMAWGETALKCSKSRGASLRLLGSLARGTFLKSGKQNHCACPIPAVALVTGTSFQQRPFLFHIIGRPTGGLRSLTRHRRFVRSTPLCFLAIGDHYETSPRLQNLEDYTCPPAFCTCIEKLCSRLGALRLLKPSRLSSPATTTVSHPWLQR